MRAVCRCGMLLGMFVLAAAAPAAASPGWVPSPPTLSSGTAPQDVQVASDAKGDTAVVWSDGTSVLEAERSAGGSWSAGSKIDTVAADTPQALSQTSAVAMDNSGVIYVFFIAGNGTSTEHAVVATKQIGATSWSVTTLEAHCNCSGPSVPEAGAVSPTGQAVALWVIETNPVAGFQTAVWRYATKAANSTAWSAPADLGSSGDAFEGTLPALAVDSSGDAAFVFNSFASLSTTVTEGATLPSGGSWTSIAQASAGAVTGQSSVVIDSGGNATAEFTTGSGVAAFATKTVSGSSWSTATDLSPSGATSPALAIQPDGTTTVGWVVGSTISERTRPSGSAMFNASATIPSSDTSPSGLTLAPGGDDSMVALWGGVNGSSKNVVSGARRAPGASSFTAVPDAPGTANSQPVAAADGVGDAGVAWVNATSSPSVLEATGLVTAPPTISNVSFPGTATAGTPFSYGATITRDQWTTATGSWNFGDGTTGSTSGAKTYATANTFNATLTATDPFGNQAIVMKAITVHPAAAGGGGGGGGGTHTPPLKPHLGSSINHKTHSAKFTFRGGGATAFQCALVNTGASRHGAADARKKKPKPHYAACTSPKRYKRLNHGKYEFFVRGTNGALIGPASTKKFTI